MTATGELRLPFAPPSSRTARRELMAFLAQHHVPAKDVNDIVLVLGEMLANAVSHGAPLPDGTLGARWALRSGRLHLSVEDGGHGGRLEALQVDSSATSGRGLAIIETLAERWWIERDGGTRVCAVVALRAG